MTKKELNEEILRLDMEMASLRIKIGKITSKFRSAHQTIRNIVSISYAFSRAEEEQNEGIEAIKEFSDNAWMILEESE